MHGSPQIKLDYPFIYPPLHHLMFSVYLVYKSAKLSQHSRILADLLYS